jgi:tRNA(Arg) A34 adenosine deaminase TadA
VATHASDDDLLRRAIELAERHSHDGRHGPFGAVVARDGVILGEGWNRVVARKDPTAHAEIMAIREAAGEAGTHVLEGCTIYCSCEPCPMCLGAIYWARIDRVVFAATAEDAREAGFDDAALYGEVGRGWDGRRIESEQRLREPGVEALRAWVANPRHVGY